MSNYFEIKRKLVFLFISYMFLISGIIYSNALFGDLTHEKQIAALRNLAYFLLPYVIVVGPIYIILSIKYTEVFKRGLTQTLSKNNRKKLQKLLLGVSISFNIWLGISLLLSVLLL